MIEDIRELEIFQFGDEDESSRNRRSLFSMSYTNRILYEIASGAPFAFSDSLLAEAINVNQDIITHRMKELCQEKLIRSDGERYCLNFPVFLKKDVIKINQVLPEVVEQIGNQIIQWKETLKEKVKRLEIPGNFHPERILYHILCDQIFDGYAFDELENKGILSQNGMCIGYERSPFVAGNSNRLLCSSNNATYGHTTFNSFGDADGERKDVMRMKCQVEAGCSIEEKYGSYVAQYLQQNGFQSSMVQSAKLIETISSGNKIYRNEQNQDLLRFLTELGYLTYPAMGNQVFLKVPVFTTGIMKTTEEISHWLFDKIGDEIQCGIEKLLAQTEEMTSVRHKVNQLETANELWHQVFGGINEYLVQSYLVEKPVYKLTEGRYLQSVLVYL